MAETTKITASQMWYNAVLPFDPRKMKLLMGSAEYVAIEVLVSALVRFIMKAPKG